jgi:hypothetical protein
MRLGTDVFREYALDGRFGLQFPGNVIDRAEEFFRREAVRHRFFELPRFELDHLYLNSRIFRARRSHHFSPAGTPAGCSHLSSGGVSIPNDVKAGQDDQIVAVPGDMAAVHERGRDMICPASRASQKRVQF